jgi:hypothetical protein
MKRKKTKTKTKNENYNKNDKTTLDGLDERLQQKMTMRACRQKPVRTPVS